MNGLFAKTALLPEGWARNVTLEWNAEGLLTAVSPDSVQPQAAWPVADVLLPGMPNLHSHAFQRAMAGLTEYRSASQDSFWSWRTLMYAFAQKLDPDLLKAVASQLYIEMLQAGYTSVCEFHYIHHDIGGLPYSDQTLLAQCLVEAAEATGMGLTLLPVMYQYGGFGNASASSGQARFLNSPDWMLNTLATLQRLHPQHAGLRYGVAPHSLRAVSQASLQQLLDGLADFNPDAPIHIHIAEQTKEVDDCMAHYGQRPVQWLLNHFNVDARWCLVHATHMTDAETTAVARSGAVVGLCPSTEANLGDGIFNGITYKDANGVWGIGSDSNIMVDVAEELRSYEYSQRLLHRQRNVLAAGADGSVGHHLFTEALKGGARAAARPVAGLVAGQRADAIVLDASHPDLAGKQGNALLDSFVFARHGNGLITDVMTAGQWRVRQGTHVQQAIVSDGYRKALSVLLAA